MSSSLFENRHDFEEESALYYFPALESFGNDASNNGYKKPPLVLKLTSLPFISEHFEQMPVGARGWYASAFLSAMMMKAFSSSDDPDIGVSKGLDNDDSAPIGSTDKKEYSSRSMKAIDLLREDLKRACASTNNDNIFLELGSGTIGLAGVTMAWIIAQHQHKRNRKKEKISSRIKVVMTDYDRMCLDQLELNAVGVRQKFREYFSGFDLLDDNVVVADNNREITDGIIPEINVEHLDWSEYDHDQSPILPDVSSTDDDDDHDNDNNTDIACHHRHSISFSCGAALVYTEATNVCVDQVVKILSLYPESVVWVVQWPRGVWLEIFRQKLLSARYKRGGLEIEIRKFGASSSPELFSEEIQQLAQKLMPKAMQQESQMDIDYLRALRIVNTKGEGYF